MATSKRRTTARKSPSTRRTTTRSSPSARSTRSNPYVGPAIATGAVAAIAGVLAGAWFFRKSNKSLSETAEVLSGRIKDGIHEARASARSFKDKAAIFFAEDPASQEDIAKDAMALKRSGRKTSRPVDETVAAELKTGAVSY